MEEDNNFVGLGGVGADKVMAAPQPSMEDRAASNCMVDKANKGAKKMTEEKRRDAVW